MEDHQFKWYFDSFERVVSSHNNKIPLYQQNHENFKTIFFVYDESTAYTQLFAGQTYIIPEKVKSIMSLRHSSTSMHMI